MIEIRRIADEEGDRVAELWDRMCRETPDGVPLTDRDAATSCGPRRGHHPDQICIDNDEAQRVWLNLGFARDMVCSSLY